MTETFGWWMIALMCLNICVSGSALLAASGAVDCIGKCNDCLRSLSNLVEGILDIASDTRRHQRQNFDHTNAHLQAIRDGQSAASEQEEVKRCLHDIQDRAAKYLRSLPSKES